MIVEEMMKIDFVILIFDYMIVEVMKFLDIYKIRYIFIVNDFYYVVGIIFD